MLCLPFEDAPLAGYPTVESWLPDVPDLLANALRRWDLTPHAAYIGGVSGSVIAVTRADGSDAVLKIAYPHAEGMFEAVGLQSFPEGLAPEVLEQDPWTWSMLLQRVDPGDQLAHTSLGVADAITAGARLHRELSRGHAGDHLPHLDQAMRDYATGARQRLPEQHAALDALGVRALVADCVDNLEELAVSGPTGGLLHGDYNPGNILSSRSPGGWVVVDPKPLVGDPAYDLWPLVSQLGSPHTSPDPEKRLAEQLALAADQAECDRERAAQWSLARTGLNVSWYLADGHPELAEAEARALKHWAVVAAY